MADAALTAIRATLRILPAPLRERWAARLFMTVRQHGEPAREADWRARGEAVVVGTCAATLFAQKGVAVDAPVAILIHGWEGRGLQLSTYIQPLLSAGYRVLAIDGPGHGRSDEGLPGIAPFAMTLQDAINEFPVRMIVAHSMGSAAAILAGARESFDGKILCLGGPPDSEMVFERARQFLGLPPSGKDRFMGHLERLFKDVPYDDIWFMEENAARCCGPLCAVLARSDDEIPWQESKAIVEAGGGAVHVLDHPSHRSVMWDEQATRIGLDFLLGDG